MASNSKRLWVVVGVSGLLSGCVFFGPSKNFECGYQNLTSSTSYIEQGVTRQEAKIMAKRSCQASQYGWHCGFKYCRNLSDD